MSDGGGHEGVVDANLGLLADQGITLSPEHRILDFGCGSGRHVYDHLDRGFPRCQGFDLHDQQILRRAQDRDHFLVGADGRVPAAEGRFDFVYSSQVFEHVRDPVLAFAEIHRVLKAGGVARLSFPARWRPVEGHVRVPLGGVLRHSAWLWLWALLGVRNEFQRGMGAAATVADNRRYLDEHLFYWTGPQLRSMLDVAFDEHRFNELGYLEHSRGRAHRWLLGPARACPPIAPLLRTFHVREILVRKSGHGAFP
jgi:SAM-dependent methyltransferase